MGATWHNLFKTQGQIYLKPGGRGEQEERMVAVLEVINVIDEIWNKLICKRARSTGSLTILSHLGLVPSVILLTGFP